MHKPTTEQQAIIDAIKAGQQSVMVHAYAGCAKTSTLEMASHQVKVPAIALAFNKKIAVELADRLPGNFMVKTMNGLGHAAWAKKLDRQLKLDDRKLGKLVSQIARDRKVDLSTEQWDSVRQLVTCWMHQANSPDASQDDWVHFAESKGLLDDAELVGQMARMVFLENIRMAEQGIISFDDQLYCSAMLGGIFPKFPRVFGDEAQDWSPINHLMVQQVMMPMTMLTAVGDEKQAIYAFRGADSESMANLRSIRPAWVDLPLATTFRCPKSIVARQQNHAPGFTAWSGCKDGLITQHGGQDKGWTLRQVMNGQSELTVLCRYNAPLVSLAFKLIRAGVPVQMLGRDIGKGLAGLSKKLSAKMPLASQDNIKAIIQDWIVTESSKAIANGQDNLVQSIEDRGECLLAVCDSAEITDWAQLGQAIELLFSKTEGKITLSSIHRAKGLEWPLVLHLDPFRVPSKRAVGSALVQEHNLVYVCETRTQNELALANLDDFQGV